MTTGIFEIVGPHGWRYTSQALDIPSRVATHYRNLDRNKHQCFALQQDYNKYGYAAFHTNILAVVLRDNKDLYILEQHYMEQAKRQYNTVKAAVRQCAQYTTEQITDALLWAEKPAETKTNRDFLKALVLRYQSTGNKENIASIWEKVESSTNTNMRYVESLKPSDQHHLEPDQKHAVSQMITFAHRAPVCHGGMKGNTFAFDMLQVQSSVGRTTHDREAQLATIVNAKLWEHVHDEFCYRFDAKVYNPLAEYKRISADYADKAPVARPAFAPYVFILENPTKPLCFEWIRDKNIPLNFMFGGSTMKLSSETINNIMDREDVGEFISSQKNRDFALRRAKMAAVPHGAKLVRQDENNVYLEHKGQEFVVEAKVFYALFEKNALTG